MVLEFFKDGTLSGDESVIGDYSFLDTHRIKLNFTNGWYKQFGPRLVVVDVNKHKLVLTDSSGKQTKYSRSMAGPQAASLAAIQWATIPDGTFVMESGSNGRPPNTVTIKSFQMAKTLVTNKQYKACVAAWACTPGADYGEKFSGEEQPVVGLDWAQARKFSKWVGGRLPSAAEWEYAARSAGKDWTYPWGNDEASCDRAVIGGCAYHATAPVCSKPSGNTRQELCDMAGNAWEWVQDSGHYGPYNADPIDGSAWESETSPYRVQRGGSWAHVSGFARSAVGTMALPSDRSNSTGFRPVR